MQTNTLKIKIVHTLKYVVFSTIILLAGCRGDEGPMGPRGFEGNANVKSVIYDVPSTDWSGDVDGYKAVLSVPEITTDILDNGAVLVYRLNEENPSNRYFYMLPNTSVDDTSITYMDYDVFVGEIDIYLKWIDNGVNTTEPPSSTYSFKVIIIEGTPLSTLKEKVNLSNISAVEAYLKINNSNTRIVK